MKKNLAMILSVCAAMTILAAGCGGGKESGGTTPAATPAPSAAASTEAPGGADATDPGDSGVFAEEVHITIPVYDRTKEGYPAVDDNYWTKWVQSEFGDKNNVKAEFVPIPRGDVMMTYSLLISAGNTPTIMMEYDYPKVAQWASDGAMAEISIDDFKEVAPRYYQKMVDNNQLGYTDINGKTYFVLSERPYYDRGYTYASFVRMDWLRQVGFDKVPENYEEFSTAIDAIIAAGLTDIAPIGMSLPGDAYIRNFPHRDHPVDEAEWAMHSSLGTPSFSWEPTKKLFKRQNTEYNKGWYSREYELDSSDMAGAVASDMQAAFVNGRLYRYGGYMAANVDWLSAFYENNPDAELAIESYYNGIEPGVSDYPIQRADNPFGMIVGFASNASEDQIKAAWMYMEWMCDDDVLFTMENGIEGVTYEMVDGFPEVYADYRGSEMLNHNNNIDMTCIVHASKVSGTAEENIAAITPKGIPQDFTQDLIDHYYEICKIADAGYSYSDPIFSVELATESEYTAPLLSLYQEYSVLLTKCAPEEFDALYDDFSKKFLAAGYQEIIDERLEAYNAGNTTKLPKR